LHVLGRSLRGQRDAVVALIAPMHDPAGWFDFELRPASVVEVVCLAAGYLRGSGRGIERVAPRVSFPVK
jgi:hypothetical protein